jgi:DNA-binding transcriptional regulator/RsmH inhibitor MraZ
LLRARVGLVKDVVVTGNIEKMEIWDRAKFAGIHEAADPREVLEQMGELGI